MSKRGYRPPKLCKLLLVPDPGQFVRQLFRSRPVHVNFSGPGQFTSASLLLWSYVTVPGLARRTVGQPERNSAGTHSGEEDIDWRFKC